jgi:DNA-binding XRE family transcriptional regulator
MTGNTSASDTAIVGHDRVRNKFQGILRVAQADGWTDADLAAASGVNARAIKSYRVEGKEPSLSAALSLACVLGPKALNPVLSLIGYVAKPLDEPDAIQPMQIVADAMGSLATISRAAADNRIDHTEEPETTAAADMLIATVLPLSSAGRAA